MPPPDWAKNQKPDEKSPHHGKPMTDEDKAKGLGGQRHPHERDPDTDPLPPEPDVDSPEVGALLEAHAEAGIEPLAGATLGSSSYYIGSVPPVQDQGATPQCVAYSNAYDQNQQDRPESGHFWNFNEGLFFQRIGGTSQGAYMSAGLERRKTVGYPEQDATPNPGAHLISGYVQIPLTVTAIKTALLRGHGVLVIGDYFHSWFYPRASGALPAPDYKIGGHARWWRGWNDNYGFRQRGSWGTGYGIGGDVFEPYAFLRYLYAAYRTADA